MVVQARTLEFYGQYGLAAEVVERGVVAETAHVREGGSGGSREVLAIRFPFIDQHAHRRIVDEVPGRNSDHRNGFFSPQIHDATFDNLTGLIFTGDSVRYGN